MPCRSGPIRVLCLVACFLAPLPPVWAEVHGGIEIGSKGIRAIAVDVAAAPAEPKVLMLDNVNTTLVADLAAKKQFSPKALQETAEAVGRLAQKIRAEYKVPDKRLYIVGSSGLFAPLEGDAALIKANKALLTEAIRQQTALSMAFVSITREAELTITSVIPAQFRTTAVLMDIGSGNTKGGAELKDRSLLTFGIPFGTVTFTDRVNKEAGKGEFAKTAAVLRVKLLEPRLSESLRGKTDLTSRKRLYVAGGTVWALVSFMKPLDRGTFVPLSSGDVDAFHKFLLEHPAELPNPSLAPTASADVKKTALKELVRVRRTFSRDQLLGGVEILKALSVAFRFDDPDRQIYFARQAYIGWILGYTVEKGTLTP